MPFGKLTLSILYLLSMSKVPLHVKKLFSQDTYCLISFELFSSKLQYPKLLYFCSIVVKVKGSFANKKNGYWAHFDTTIVVKYYSFIEKF